MHLVDGYGRVERVPADPALHPGRVAPLVARGIVDDGGGAGEPLGPEAEGIGLQGQEVAFGAYDLVLVKGALADPRDEDLPHPHPRVLSHSVPPSIPQIELPDHRDAAGVRRPDGEARAGDAFELHRVRSELLVEREVAALTEEVEVLLAENRGEPVRVVDLDFSVPLPRDPEPVWHHPCDGAGEEPVRVYRIERAQDISTIGYDLHCARPRQKSPHHEAVLRTVHPEEGERVGVVAGHDGEDCVFVPQDSSSPTGSPRRSRMPPMGIPTQSGRLSSS